VVEGKGAFGGVNRFPILAANVSVVTIMLKTMCFEGDVLLFKKT